MNTIEFKGRSIDISAFNITSTSNTREKALQIANMYNEINNDDIDKIVDLLLYKIISFKNQNNSYLGPSNTINNSFSINCGIGTIKNM
jgi:capsular polysaccharide biosynthesis protein